MPDGFALFDAVIALALLPLLWSGLLFFCLRRHKPDGRAEPIVLVLMVLPVLLASLVLTTATPLPRVVAANRLDIAAFDPVLPVMTVSPVSASRSDWLQLAMLVLVGLYCAGTAWRAVVLLREQAKYRFLMASAQPHPDWPDVLIAAMDIPAFAASRHVVLSRLILENFAPQAIALIVSHECAHIAQHHPRYYTVLAWIDVLFWFNPFVRAQTRKCRLAAEMACDAAVLAAAPSMRKAYATTIVAVLRHAAGNALACAPAAISPRNLGDHGMRIKEIMAPSSRRSKRAAFALAALLAIPAGAVQLAYAQAAAGAASLMMLPLHGRVSSVYGDTHEFFGKPRVHNGIDIVAQAGAPVIAPAAGRVVYTNQHDGNYGTVLEIAHANGLVTRYAHLESIEVTKDEVVKAGQVIARVGSSGISTGPHLHLQVLRNGQSINPAEVFELKKS